MDTLQPDFQDTYPSLTPTHPMALDEAPAPTPPTRQDAPSLRNFLGALLSALTASGSRAR